ASLAGELGGAEWGYRRLDTYAGFAGVPRRQSRYDLAWMSPEVTIGQRIGRGATTAQVHPARFTRALMGAAEARGARLRAGRVTGIALDDRRAVGVEVG